MKNTRNKNPCETAKGKGKSSTKGKASTKGKGTTKEKSNTKGKAKTKGKSNTKGKASTKKGRQQKKKQNVSSLESESEACFCIICMEPYGNSCSGEDWIQCITRGHRAHEECTDIGTRNFVFECPNCESDI